MLARRTLPTISVSIVCLVAACRESAGPKQDAGVQAASALALQAGDSQFALVGRQVPINPAVRVVDDSGNTVQGITVMFAVTSGGGTATGTSAVSDSAGIATVGSWVLGPDLGTNTMTATISNSADVSPFVFTAIALCDCWKERAALNQARRLAGSAVLNGKLYVLGGLNQRDNTLPVEEYDPASDTWTVRGTAPAQYKTGVVALSGELYIVAGDFNSTTTSLQSYDPVTGRWTVHPAPPTPRSQMEAAVVDGRLYVLGGIDEITGLLPTVEAFDPATETWTTVAPMPRGRRWASVAVVDGILYVIGGEARGGPGTYVSEIVASVIAYDPKTDTWTEKASLPELVSNAAVGVVSGRIYVAGGTHFEWTGTGPDLYATEIWSSYVYVYDPQMDQWSIQSPMRTGRYEATAAELDGVLYVIGGIGTRGAMLGIVEALNP